MLESGLHFWQLNREVVARKLVYNTFNPLKNLFGWQPF